MCTMLMCSSPLLYNLIIWQGCSLTHSFSKPLFSPVLCNPSFQKFASYYYQVQNTVLGPWLGLLIVPQFVCIRWLVITVLNMPRSFPLSVTVPQHIPWTHWYICHVLATVYKLCFAGGGWFIPDSWVAITMYWLLWYMARWDKCVTVLWGSCWKTVLCQWKI